MVSHPASEVGSPGSVFSDVSSVDSEASINETGRESWTAPSEANESVPDEARGVQQGIGRLGSELAPSTGLHFDITIGLQDFPNGAQGQVTDVGNSHSVTYGSDRSSDNSNNDYKNIPIDYLSLSDAESNQSDGRNLFESLDVKVQRFVKDVCRIQPPAIAAGKTVSALRYAIGEHIEIEREIMDLVLMMDEIVDVINSEDDHTTSESLIIEFLRQSTECCIYLQSRASGRLTRSGQTLEFGSRSQKAGEFRARFSDLKEALTCRSIPHTTFVSTRILEMTDITSLRQQLDLLSLLQQMLRPAAMEGFNQPKCLPGTRAGILGRIAEWIFSDTFPNILWLCGLQGTGKTAINMAISEMCAEMLRLGTHISFGRSNCDPSSVVRTIAYSLASFDPTVAIYMTDAIRFTTNISSASLDVQFEKLLLEPLSAIAESTQGPTAILLDGLDKCGTPDARSDLLTFLTDALPKLPPNYRFLLTSRPLPDISMALSQKSVLKVAVDHTSDLSHRDVLQYIQHEIRNILERQGVEVPTDWPWNDNMALLSDTADGRFSWVSAAVEKIAGDDDPFNSLEELLTFCRCPNAEPPSTNRFGFTNWYDSVLKESGISWDNTRSREHFSRILYLIAASKAPLSVTAIDGLLGLPRSSSSRRIITLLQSELVYSPEVPDAPVHPLHGSFVDYLLSSERSGQPWFIDVPTQRLLIASRCLDVMRDKLRFNICKLKSSFVRNDQVESLDDTVKCNIAPDLKYACQFWAEHLREVPSLSDSADLLDILDNFAKNHLLQWFEVLSLTKQSSQLASHALLDSVAWLETRGSDLSSFLRDASRLAKVFSLPISQSVPHIYLSVLSFSKGESVVADHYSRNHPTIRVRTRGRKPPLSCVRVLKGHSEQVSSVAVSPDGKRIAAGSWDGTIRVWNAVNGNLLAGPLEGRTDYVTSIAFSPDGELVASGSRDGTVRIWSVETGVLVYGPLKGHRDWVTSVAFSPDGKCIASGSDDNTIRVWNVEDGDRGPDIFEGHASYLTSVAYSPGGGHILSGSLDGTIRVWNARSGRNVLGPFKKHTSCVRSVAFSPDGMRFASGSEDKTILIWDATSGEAICGPLRGHEGPILSVAYSPDGRYLASGSGDGTIRVWNSDSGLLVSALLGLYIGSVNSVVFSPDGSHIVSGLEDGTVRLWDTESLGIRSDLNSVESSPNEQSTTSGPSDRDTRLLGVEGEGLFAGPFEGHGSGVLSCTFSSDGERIASGSQDGTICVWEAQSGKQFAGPLRGHTDWVRSVVFSPDRERIVSGSDDRTVRIWDTQSGELVMSPLRGHEGYVLSVVFSPDGRLIASGSADNTVRVWNVQSGELDAGPFKGHTGWVRSVTFSPDGKRIASGSGDKTVRIWDIQSGELVMNPLRGHEIYVMSVVYSPDGRYIASGSMDRTICVWDAESGKLIVGPLLGHQAPVLSVSYSPDGKHIASGSEDKTIRVWDAESGVPVFSPLRGHTGEVSSVAFSPDGERILSGSSDSTMRIWDAEYDQVSRAFLTGNQPDEVLRRIRPGTYANWNVSDDGWLLGQNGELLMWIPLEVLPTLWQPSNTAVFSCRFSTKLNFSGCRLGDGWGEGHSDFK